MNTTEVLRKRKKYDTGQKTTSVPHSQATAKSQRQEQIHLLHEFPLFSKFFMRQQQLLLFPGSGRIHCLVKVEASKLMGVVIIKKDN